MHPTSRYLLNHRPAAKFYLPIQGAASSCMFAFFVGNKIEKPTKIHGNTANTRAKIIALSPLLPNKSSPIPMAIAQGKKLSTPRIGAMANRNAPKVADFVLKARMATGAIISNMGARKTKVSLAPIMGKSHNVSHHVKQAEIRRVIVPKICIKFCEQSNAVVFQKIPGL